MTAEHAADRPALDSRPAPRRDPKLVVLNWFRELTLVPVIVVLMIAGAVVNPVFFTPSNLINVAEGGAALGMVVVAESLILLTGNHIDLLLVHARTGVDKLFDALDKSFVPNVDAGL